MEIINLLLLLFFYYSLYYFEFYQKVLLLFSASMYVSMLVNHKSIEYKSKNSENNKIIYGILFKLIQFTFYTYNSVIYFKNKAFEFKIVNKFYGHLNQVNNHYLIGRNKIMQKVSGVALNAFTPFSSNLLLNNPMLNNTQQQKPRINLEEKKKDEVFKNPDDMNNFLDNLIDKKNN